MLAPRCSTPVRMSDSFGRGARTENRSVRSVAAHGAVIHRSSFFARQQRLDPIVFARLKRQLGPKGFFIEAFTSAHQEVQRLTFFRRNFQSVQIRTTDLRAIGQNRAVFKKETNGGELAEVAIFRDVLRSVMQSETVEAGVLRAPFKPLGARRRRGDARRRSEKRLSERRHMLMKEWERRAQEECRMLERPARNQSSFARGFRGCRKCVRGMIS